MAESIRQRGYIETTIPSFSYEVRTVAMADID